MYINIKKVANTRLVEPYTVCTCKAIHQKYMKGSITDETAGLLDSVKSGQEVREHGNQCANSYCSAVTGQGHRI